MTWWRTFGLVAAAVLVLDLGTKALFPGDSNPEFALGAASAPGWVMVALMALVALLGLLAARRWHAPAWAAGLALGGAIANLADRLVYGQVRDFIPLGQVIVFNLADVAIVAGLIGWLLSSSDRKEVHTR